MAETPKFDPAQPISASNIPARPLRTFEVHQILGFSVRTILNYVEEGIFTAIQAGPGKGIRIRHESVRELLNKADPLFGRY